MRPVRIELEGFSAFRDRTVVDLDGVDLFALVGPTGSGKSSVIDAMVFALYGSVPRYDSESLVYPVITQGAPEARVRLDFELDGVAYTAVRVVRRTKTGASTKEARLERGATVLADDAKGMSATVADLLGLDFAQFTRCVVLPQGAFAALLHDTAARRQDLLVRLLDLGRYAEIGRRARGIAKDAEATLRVLDEQLARLSATEATVSAAAERVAMLDRIRQDVDDASGDLAAAAEAERTARQRADTIRDRAATVRGVSRPNDLAAMLDAVTTAESALAAAETQEQAAASRVLAAVEARDPLGPIDELRTQLERLLRADDLAARVEKGTAMVAESERAVDGPAQTLAAAESALVAASTALEEALLADRAAAVAADVHPGEDCPVCGNTITDLRVAPDGALTRARAAVDEARQTQEHAQQSHAAAVRERDKLTDALANRRDSLAAAQAEIEAHAERVGTDPDAIRDRIAAITAADAAVDGARRDDTTARAAATEARRRLERARAEAAAARSSYQRQRDAVAAFGPPAATDDLGADWDALIDWCTTDLTTTAEALRAAEAAATAARDARQALLAGLVDAATAVGVRVPDPERVRDAVVDARAEADNERAAAQRQVDERASVAERRAEVDVERAVHQELAAHLGARRFEAWLLAEALDALLDGATTWLEQLSSGRYALDVDDKQTFVVIDHNNADERRLARTLSGGETFLASLALALALAEQITELSAHGGRRLEAMFLDEGFGTLDADTLDVVATAIEELGATGRTVGIISHVPELAERVPVRFDVRKGPTTSTVERVER